MVRHNNRNSNGHFNKKWRSRMKTWFSPKPIQILRLAVYNSPSVRYNNKLRNGRRFPIRDFIASISEIIANAPPEVKPDEHASLGSVVEEMVEQLAGDELLALLYDKLANSPDFKQLYNEVSSDEARNLVEEILHNDEVQRLADRLRDMDVKVDELLARLYGFLGWGEPKVQKSPRDLADLQDLIDLLSLGALEAVIEGQEFSNLVDEVLGKSAVQAFLDYLSARFHEFLGWGEP